ncbi:MAG: TlpA disulfide reductase family protein, partial [Bacteroidota bacterium]
DIKKPKDDLNSRLREFNSTFNGFLLEHQEQLIKPRNKELVSKLKKLISEKFATENNPYLKTTIEYRMATFEQMQFVCTKEDLANRYLIHRPVQFANMDYMEFVNQYFYRYAAKPSFYSKTEHIRNEIENNESYNGLATLFATDSVLKKNDTLREIVILTTLQDYYQDGLYQGKPILNIISYVAQKGMCIQTRRLAQNIYESLTKMKALTKVPELTVFDNAGKAYKINDSKGKFVYLCFWTSWSVPSLEEIKMIPMLEKKFGERVDFVCINADKKPENFMAALKEYSIEGRQYYGGKDQKMLESYKIVSFPTFVLIDPSQNILQYPARKPSEEIEDYILMYLLKEDPKKWDPYKKKDGFKY